MTLDKIEQNTKSILDALSKYESEKSKRKKKRIEKVVVGLGEEINKLVEEEKKNVK